MSSILEGHLIPDNIRTKMTKHMELHLVYKFIVLQYLP